MNNKDVGNNEEEKKGINIVTLVVCVFVVIFVAAGFASGGVVPAVMTVLVILFVTNSLKKQFRKVNGSDEDDEAAKDDSDEGTKAAVDIKADTFESDDKTTIVLRPSLRSTPIRMKGESFDSFMLRRFGLTKATSATTDAESEAKKADQAARADDLYDPDQYESVNEDLSEMDPDVLTVNGRKTKFKQKKNPFEM